MTRNSKLATTLTLAIAISAISTIGYFSKISLHSITLADDLLLTLNALGCPAMVFFLLRKPVAQSCAGCAAKSSDKLAAAGNVEQLFGTCTDIEAIVQADELRSRLAAIVESSDDAILSKRLDGTILSWNAAAEKLFGYRAQEIIGKHITTLLPPERLAEELGIIERIRSGGRCDHMETVRVTKDGRRIDVSLTISPVKDRDGNVVGASKIVRDITEQKRAQQALDTAMLIAEEAKARAEAANHTKDHFIAVLSHELRTPLNPLLAAASLLMNDPHVDAHTRELANVISRNALTEARLIDDLLDVTRIERGKLELERVPLDVGALIRELIEESRSELLAKKVEISVEFESEPYSVDGDSTRLRQVFWNLLSNAIKFTPAQSAIRFCGRKERSGVVVIHINDQGVGIETEAMPRIFNAFQQADRSVTRRFGGLGLGLAISKAITELHGGTISATSEGSGKGATFEIRLPLADSVVSQPQPHQQFNLYAHPESVPADDSTPVLRPLRILLVEDHVDTARVMSRVLRQEGHLVVHAVDVAGSLKHLQDGMFDLLLSDIGLPDGSGWDIMRNLRTSGSLIPGIALSGYGQQTDVQTSLDVGYCAHLTKPIDISTLVSKIRECSPAAA